MRNNVISNNSPPAVSITLHGFFTQMQKRKKRIISSQPVPPQIFFDEDHLGRKTRVHLSFVRRGENNNVGRYYDVTMVRYSLTNRERWAARRRKNDCPWNGAVYFVRLKEASYSIFYAMCAISREEERRRNMAEKILTYFIKCPVETNDLLDVLTAAQTARHFFSLQFEVTTFFQT